METRFTCPTEAALSEVVRRTAIITVSLKRKMTKPTGRSPVGFRRKSPYKPLPINACSELKPPRAVVDCCRVRDLAESRRGRVRIPDVEERMVQEVQRHQPPGHPQPLTDADFLVDTHIQKIEGVVAQIDERGELTRSERRTVER